MEIRETHLIVSADVEIMFANGHVENFRISDIPCVWEWDEMSRTACEYWAAFDYIGNTWHNYDWFSIKSWTGSPVKEKSLSALTEEYAFWCKAQGLKCVDAMELICDGELNSNQNAWVVDFITRWEEAEEADLQECWHREGKDTDECTE